MKSAYCTPTDGWIKKTWCVGIMYTKYTMEYLSAIKNRMVSFAGK
jgi:hypothetical protein